MFLLAGGVLLLFAFLGALQAFNMSEFRFLNPETSGETLAFLCLIVLVFLLLLLLLTLLFRNILKLYADQSGSALRERGCARGWWWERPSSRCDSRGVHVPVQLSALEPLHRSLVFAATSDLREDSTQVVRELAQYAWMPG